LGRQTFLLEGAMSSRHTPRIAIAATVFAVLTSESHLSRLARADDPAKPAHESAVLDRIFANWKARHDRVRTLHFTIDSRIVYKSGEPDPSRFDPQARLDRDQLFQQFGVQIWIDCDDRMCVVTTPTFKVPQAKLAATNRVADRWVQVGQTISIFSASPYFETGVAPRKPFAPHGSVLRNPGRDRPLTGPVVRPLLLTYRPQDPSINWLRDQCRLVDENSPMEGSRSIMFQRVVEPSSNVPVRRDEACWVSPARSDIIVHWRIKTANQKIDGSVKHKKDETFDWVPSEWTIGTKGASGFSEYAMVKYELNQKVDPAVFSQSFPPGTPVQEQVGTGAARKLHWYVVQPDGSQRPISREQYYRLARF